MDGTTRTASGAAPTPMTESPRLAVEGCPGGCWRWGVCRWWAVARRAGRALRAARRRGDRRSGARAGLAGADHGAVGGAPGAAREADLPEPAEGCPALGLGAGATPEGRAVLVVPVEARVLRVGRPGLVEAVEACTARMRRASVMPGCPAVQGVVHLGRPSRCKVLEAALSGGSPGPASGPVLSDVDVFLGLALGSGSGVPRPQGYKDHSIRIR
jgi:hypothetical protein